MTNRSVSLDRLRDLVLQNQQGGSAKPTSQAQKIFVDREGRIVEGGQQQSAQQLSEVPQDTFAGRLEDDRTTVGSFLPKNAQEYVTSEGVTGWVYKFRCEFGDEYRMFVWYDGANYQVLVLAPQLEHYWQSPHTGHIYSSGQICFGTEYGSGRPTLRDAYTKSVLWANGISAARHGQTHFPFSINNVA
jgi:hypothetical protein